MDTTTKNRHRTIVRIALLAAVAVLSAACSKQQASAPTDQEGSPASVRPMSTALPPDMVGESVLVAKGPTHDADVAVDPETDAIYAAWAVDTNQKPSLVMGDPQDIMVARSDDGGATWSKPVRVNDTPGYAWTGMNSQVRIAVSAPGHVFVMWQLGLADWSFYVMRDVSTDGGKTWGKDASITSGDPGPSQEGYAALTNVGKDLYVAFLDYRETAAPHSPTGVGFLHSKDGGVHFAESHRAVLRSCECCDNGIAVDAKGTLYVAFRSQEAAGEHTTIRDSAVVRSYDDGETWSLPVFMGKDNWVYNGCPEGGPEVMVGTDDVVHGVYWTGKDGRAGVYYTSSTDGGKSFAQPMPVATDDFYPPAYVDLAQGADDSVWVTWDDRRLKDKKVHLARIQGESLEVLEDLSLGETPALGGNDEMTVMVWSDPEGLRFAQLGGTGAA